MVLIIAEIGINHNGNIHLAHEMIRQAAIAGADVAKFQAYSVDALFGPDGEDPNEEIWKGVKPLEFNQEQFAQLKQWCDEEGIEFMSSVFDEERFQWMEELDVKRHKVASRTSKLTPDLATKMIASGKECLVSLGFEAKPIWGVKHPNEGQIRKPDNVRYLYCVAEYPAEYSSLKMPCVFPLHPIYDGFSDHTLGIEASLVAVARGATIIEKHFTLSKSAQGFDHVCSITPDELSDLVKYTRRMEKVVK